jgi:hypothetical protein
VSFHGCEVRGVWVQLALLTWTVGELASTSDQDRLAIVSLDAVKGQLVQAVARTEVEERKAIFSTTDILLGRARYDMSFNVTTTCFRRNGKRAGTKIHPPRGKATFCCKLRSTCLLCNPLQL